MKKKITSPIIRKEIILNHLKYNNNLITKEIAKEVNVSEITIRRDLIEMEEKGLLIRTYNGAIRNNILDDFFSYDDKINQKKDEKEHICKIAATFIKAGDIIFIDCGSTVSLMTQHIKKIESLTVVTNSLPIAYELLNYENIKLILIGGEVDSKRKAIYGHSAIKNISLYHANKAFIGTDGVSLLHGITSHNEKAASVTIKMAENSDEVFLLCDSSKIEKNSFVKFAPISIINYIITDKNIDQSLISKYEDHNITLLCEEQKTELKAMI